MVEKDSTPSQKNEKNGSSAPKSEKQNQEEKAGKMFSEAEVDTLLNSKLEGILKAKPTLR